jgi:hypothetical protein
LRLVALIEAPPTVARLLRRLGLAAELPVPRPAREPPLAIAIEASGIDERAAVDDD